MVLLVLKSCPWGYDGIEKPIYETCGWVHHLLLEGLSSKPWAMVTVLECMVDLLKLLAADEDLLHPEGMDHQMEVCVVVSGQVMVCPSIFYDDVEGSMLSLVSLCPHRWLIPVVCVGRYC